MESMISTDLATEKSALERRAKALAVIRARPLSVLSQLIVLLFAFAALLLMAFFNYLVWPSLNPFPYATVVLLGALGSIATNVFANQRRLEALIELLEKDINKS